MATSIWEHFSVLRAPRLERTKLHKLEDILTIALCAVLCGAETWMDIADFGRTKEAFLCTFLELPHGILSDDIFGRLFETRARGGGRGLNIMGDFIGDWREDLLMAGPDCSIRLR